MLPNEEAYRLVFGEADLLSGLIVDVYGQYAALQMLSAGMDRAKPHVIEALRQVLPDLKGIIEKNTAQTRKKEGLELVDAVVWGEIPERVLVRENGLALEIDLLGGQKTGYFLDQKINRRVVGSLSAGRSVLDCFCNVGGFALNAAMGGAAMALGVDSSEAAISSAIRHAEINGLDNCQFVKANVFDLLREHIEHERVWDMVVLDPPSFAKSRSAIRGALAGYSELNRSALKLLRPGGLLVSSSCTQLVSEHDLLDILYRESARIRKRLRLVHRGSQAPDHPVLLSMPETQYLKFLVFEVIGDP
jgi:23S rRNA (cytosine1962-C5)-methyltransferase